MALLHRVDRSARAASWSMPTPIRRTLAVLATRAPPRWVSSLTCATCSATTCPVEGCFGCCFSAPGSLGRSRPTAVLRQLADRCTPRGAGLAVAAATCSACACCRRRGSTARTSWSARPSGSACRWVRRSARRLHRRALRAWSVSCPDGSWASRSTRPAGRPTGLALQTPRAAHPPREGHQQHLHRAGPARGDRAALRRRTTGPRGCARIARARARSCRRRWPAACGHGWRRSAHERVLRHRRVAVVPAEAERSSPRLSPRGSTCGWSMPIGSGSRPTRSPSSAHVRDGAGTPWPPRWRSGRAGVERRRGSLGLPDDLACGQRLPDRIRSSTTHRSETAMMPHLRRLADYDLALDRGDDPAGLVHR